MRSYTAKRLMTKVSGQCGRDVTDVPVNLIVFDVYMTYHLKSRIVVIEEECHKPATNSKKLKEWMNVTQSMKLKHKDLESCLSRICSFYSIALQCWTVAFCKIVFNKDLSVYQSGNIWLQLRRMKWKNYLTNFLKDYNKFTEISEQP